MSTEVAVATVKRYVAEDRHRVRLEDLTREETEAVFAAAATERTNQDGEALTDAYLRHLRELEAVSERLCRMSVALATYDDGTSATALTRSVERLLQVPHLTGSAIQQLQRYPALLLFYSTGIAAIRAEHYHSLASLMLRPTVWQRDINVRRPAIEWLTPADVLEKNWLPAPHRRNYAFGSSYLHEVVRPLLEDLIPDEDRYIWEFDLFDALVGLVFRDLTGSDGSPIGAYVWRWIRRHVEHPLQEFVSSRGVESLLSAGFFGGSRERLDELMVGQEERLNQARRTYH